MQIVKSIISCLFSPWAIAVYCAWFIAITGIGSDNITIFLIRLVTYIYLLMYLGEVSYRHDRLMQSSGWLRLLPARYRKPKE